MIGVHDIVFLFTHYTQYAMVDMPILTSPKS